MARPHAAGVFIRWTGPGERAGVGVEARARGPGFDDRSADAGRVQHVRKASRHADAAQSAASGIARLVPDSKVPCQGLASQNIHRASTSAVIATCWNQIQKMPI